MLTYFRYALATLLFAASVGCLALWWRSYTHLDSIKIGRPYQFGLVSVISHGGEIEIAQGMRIRYAWPSDYTADLLWFEFVSGTYEVRHPQVPDRPLRFLWDGIIILPIWYASLIFALAGVAAIKLGRRFTLRSAIIATTVVAGLLGMAVGM